jgi:hypothetical protein
MINKRMREFLLVALMVITLSGSARARLGDKSEIIEDLYGNLVERHLRDDESVSVLYHNGRYLYLVIFVNDRSVSESYSHINGSDFSDKEIAKFLKANSAGATWMPVNISKERRFKRSDDRAEATYGRSSGRQTLTVREIGGRNNR